MSRRQAKQSEGALNKLNRRAQRWGLVHSAGCTYRPHCVDCWYLHDDIRADCPLEPGTRIPRSLRKIFGFRVAP